MKPSLDEEPASVRAPEAPGAAQDLPGSMEKRHSRTIVHRAIPHCPGLKGLHPLLQQVFSARGIRTRSDLDHSLAGLPSPGLLRGIEAATQRLVEAVDCSETILILGDYDTDGATSSALAILGLGSLGAGDVRYLVPNRFDYGYGLSPEIAEVAKGMAPSLVITVDNGISSLEGVRVLRSAGIDVIVTDHHLPGETLPDANAIVNPNQPECGFPSRMLAGVGVMFYLLLAVRGAMRQRGDFSGGETPNLAQFLDLVALGTVADLVSLDHVNRTLVSQGIARMQQGQCRPGIQALLEVAGKDLSRVSSSDLGFVVAPRLNAAGRLDDIALGIECLLAEDRATARRHAATLHRINAERREIQQKMQEEALAIAAGISDMADGFGICLFGSDWHQGITGLVASRLKDRFFQPAIVFAPAGEGLLTGSARSIPGLHIRDLLAEINRQRGDLMLKFGGHAMAAGMTIEESSFGQFKDCFRAAVTRHYENAAPSDEIITDGPLAAEFFTREIATLLRNAAPWGQQFPPPVFDNEFRVLSQRVVGGQHLKLRLRSRDRTVDAIAFRHLEPGQEAPEYDHVRAAFQLDVNEYRGERNLQLIVEHLEPL